MSAIATLRSQIYSILNKYVTSFNGRTGDVKLKSSDVTDALGFTPEVAGGGGGGGSVVTMVHEFYYDKLYIDAVLSSIIPRYTLFDDFIGNNNYLGGGVYLSEFVVGSGANAGKYYEAQLPTVGNYGAGFAYVTTGITATGLAILETVALTNRNGIAYVDADYYYRVGWKQITCTALSTGTDDYTLSIGIGINSITSDHAWFSYNHAQNSGNWTTSTINSGGTPEEYDTGIAMAVNTPFDLDLEIYNNLVKFYINDVLVATHSVNRPTHGRPLYGPIMRTQKSAGTQARNTFVGAIYVRHEHKSTVEL